MRWFECFEACAVTWHERGDSVVAELDAPAFAAFSFHFKVNFARAGQVFRSAVHERDVGERQRLRRDGRRDGLEVARERWLSLRVALQHERLSLRYLVVCYRELARLAREAERLGFEEVVQPSGKQEWEDVGAGFEFGFGSSGDGRGGACLLFESDFAGVDDSVVVARNLHGCRTRRWSGDGRVVAHRVAFKRRACLGEGCFLLDAHRRRASAAIDARNWVECLPAGRRACCGDEYSFLLSG